MADPPSPKMQPHQIKPAPASMFYIPNFITETEEANILEKALHPDPILVNSLTNCRQIPPNQWISLTHRRLQAIPARLTASNALVTNKALPAWLLRPAVERVNDLGIFKNSPHGAVNHCLINEYLPGQGIMPHEDGAAYHPVVATISLGTSIVLDVTEKVDHSLTSNDQQRLAPQRRWRILQESRSLLVTTGSAYTETLHGIAEVEVDFDLSSETVANWELLGDPETVTAKEGRNERGTRVSLTLRDVLKVSDIGSKIFGRHKG